MIYVCTMSLERSGGGAKRDCFSVELVAMNLEGLSVTAEIIQFHVVSPFLA